MPLYDNARHHIEECQANGWPILQIVRYDRITKQRSIQDDKQYNQAIQIAVFLADRKGLKREICDWRLIYCLNHTEDNRLDILNQMIEV